MTPDADTAPTLPTRDPLRLDALRVALADAGSPDPAARIDLLDECESTNQTAGQLPPEATAATGWALVAAERQVAGRGRLGRRWDSPAGAGLLFSLLLDVPPGADPALVGLLPLAAGVAVVDACQSVGVAAGLKWPNDIVVEPGPADGVPLGKLGGLLAERSPRGVVIGVGLNVSLTRAEAPTPEATALAEHGLIPAASREVVLAACVVGIVAAWRRLLAGDRLTLAQEYRERCLTLGRRVRVARPAGAEVTGLAVDIDGDGHLLLREDSGAVSVLTAGDVSHLRAAQLG